MMVFEILWRALWAKVTDRFKIINVEKDDIKIE